MKGVKCREKRNTNENIRSALFFFYFFALQILFIRMRYLCNIYIYINAGYILKVTHKKRQFLDYKIIMKAKC